MCNFLHDHTGNYHLTYNIVIPITIFSELVGKEQKNGMRKSHGKVTLEEKVPMGMDCYTYGQ
jgi:hypothetical protein